MLSPKDFFRCSGGAYRRVEALQPSPVLVQMQMPEMERIEQLLRWLKGQAALRYAANARRLVNYEDLAYLAAQIRDDWLGQYENPALGPLLCCALNLLPGLCSPEKLGEQTVNYIADVVAEMLAADPTQLEHLGIFRDTLADQRLDEANLFTLNHDCLLERFLRTEGVDVVDGFDEENSLGIRKWNPALFDCCRTHAASPAVRLFKLHGSIDWRRFRPQEAQASGQVSNPWREEYAGIRSNSTLAHAQDEQGRTHEELDRALFLAGTFNKMLDYLNHIFLELHYRFHRTLADSMRLVVCGYGFGDKGINNRITDWMCPTAERSMRKMILIEPRSLEQVRGTSRGAIARKLPSWKEDGALIHLQHKIGSPEVTWERLSAELLG